MTCMYFQVVFSWFSRARTTWNFQSRFLAFLVNFSPFPIWPVSACILLGNLNTRQLTVKIGQTYSPMWNLEKRKHWINIQLHNIGMKKILKAHSHFLALAFIIFLFNFQTNVICLMCSMSDIYVPKLHFNSSLLKSNPWFFLVLKLQHHPKYVRLNCRLSTSYLALKGY